MTDTSPVVVDVLTLIYVPVDWFSMRHHRESAAWRGGATSGAGAKYLRTSQPSYLHRPPHMADPFSLTTGIISLLTLAIKLVAGAAGMIDKTITAHREAANELQALQWDLEQLDRQMDQIHSALQLLATNTKDRAFKKLLQE